ncbi:hypothetical protein LMH87_009309 [Akanthomyces muscarius]|uniref:Major facilitator superfamily (MFS) profile domain-containing protein n=1 Tax=Akanthomyces muscarius TaxID=2231603 RepID=A0A9W8QDR2_AKAMU|nr:hypothetical protein LMH87_009309 [Akanthomyces muscarius]KAJ4152789.1 hypothetical protein LMH87_009309 [Akanthomyces muscarius]
MENGGAISPKQHVNEIQDTGFVHIDVTEGDADNVCSKTTNHFEVDLTPDEQRRVIRRVDLRLVVTVGIMYCVSLMDRTNMSAANIAGMKTELHLEGFQYNIANLVFFVPYIIFQAPSILLVRRIGPRLHLAGITVLWGATMIGMGFVQSFSALAGLRAILGLLEAGFFPSCVYLLSTWYTRYEIGKRYSLFYLLGSVASAFSGILAYGLMQLNRQRGITGWRWIFLVEGALTCALACISYWLLVDFPDSQQRQTWKFLKPSERQWIINRIQEDRKDVQVPPFHIRGFLSSSTDWKIWVYAMVFFNTTTVSYALAYTLPLILVGNIGFDIGTAQCLVAPPYAFAGIMMLATGWFGDKFHLRGPIIIFNMFLCLIGLPMMAGANSNIPATMAFQANNIRGQWKRAFCSVTLVGFGGIGGIAGSLIFRDQDKATGYKPGIYACIACSLLTIIVVLLCDWDFYRQNKLADKGEQPVEASANDPLDGFRYTY